MAITQVITTLPAVPDPATDTRDQFSTKAAAYVLAQKAMVPELNTWTEQVNAIVEGAAGDIASGINGAAAKTAPVDADLLTLTDSAASFVLKKFTWANLKTVLGGTFAALAGSVSQAFSAASLEVGHETDSTITRVSAGVIAVEGVNLLTTETGASLAGSTSQVFSVSNLQFPATQVPSADVNCLDDYEEGTWTPNVTNATVVGTPTYTGTYTKVGRKVTLQFKASATTSVAFTANSTTVTGFPASSSQGGGAVSCNSSIAGAVGIVFSSTLYPGTISASTGIFTTATYEV